MPATVSAFGGPAVGGLGPAAGGFGFGSAASTGFGSFNQSSISRQGSSNAARVSRGSEEDVWGGLSVKTPARHEAEHVTATIVIYNTVAGGVPSAQDVKAAIDDMESLYANCGWSGKLTDSGASFMKAAPPVSGGLFGAANAVGFPGAVSNASSFPPLATTPGAAASTYHPLSKLPSNIQNSVQHHLNAAGVTDASILQLHDSLALPMLSKGAAGGQLSEAFTLFQVANQLNTQLHGVCYGPACYNMACCLCVAARENQLAVLQRMLVPQSNSSLNALTPLASPSNLPALIEKALDAAARWVLTAVSFGWHNTAHLASDPDLSLLRERRPQLMSTAQSLASELAAAA